VKGERTEPPAIDLSADVGERNGSWSTQDDAGFLRLVTSASIACGFHAGDAVVMREMCERAVTHSVRIGAHVGYNDRLGFGRRRVNVAPSELYAETLYQVGALIACARAAGGRVAYVKPHGALYHRCLEDSEAAAAVVRAMSVVDPNLVAVAQPGSALLACAADGGLRSVAEGFVDRAYASDGTLVPRSDVRAVLDKERAVRQACEIATQGAVTTNDGSILPLTVRTLCVHGDTPNALTLVTEVRAALKRVGADIEPFA
jgi:5-oxoprolinase (ATP-hydrolysing) subunit A